MVVAFLAPLATMRKLVWEEEAEKEDEEAHTPPAWLAQAAARIQCFKHTQHTWVWRECHAQTHTRLLRSNWFHRAAPHYKFLMHNFNLIIALLLINKHPDDELTRDFHLSNDFHLMLLAPIIEKRSAFGSLEFINCWLCAGRFIFIVILFKKAGIRDENWLPLVALSRS